MHFKFKNELKPHSDALILGSAVHKLVLFFSEFKIAPAADKHTKEGKAIYNDFLEKLDNKTSLDLAAFNRAVHGGFIIGRNNTVC